MSHDGRTSAQFGRVAVFLGIGLLVVDRVFDLANSYEVFVTGVVFVGLGVLCIPIPRVKDG